MSSPDIGRDASFSNMWNSLGSQRCADCGHYLPDNSDFGRNRHATLDRARGRIVVYCNSCYDKKIESGEVVVDNGRVSSAATKVINRERERENKRHKKSKKVWRTISEEEDDDEEDDEEEDQDEFAGFFYSMTGKAIKLMFKHFGKRLDELEKKVFKD